MRRLPLATSLLLLALTATASDAQQTVRLRFLPPVGQVTHYRMVTQWWMRIPGVTPADTAQPIMKQTEYWTRTVVARKGGAWKVRTVIDSSKIGSRMGGLLGRGYVLRGAIIRQTLDSLRRMDSSEVTPPPGANAAIAEALRLINEIQWSNLSFPARPLRVGESWTDSSTVPLPSGLVRQSLHGHVTFRLDRLEREGKDRVAVISSTTFLGGNGAAASVGAASETGVMKSTYRFDLDAGRLLEMSATRVNRTGTSRIHTEIRRLK